MGSEGMVTNHVYCGKFLAKGAFWHSIAVSLTTLTIILVAMTIGSSMPLLLKRLNIDPAHAAGPLLATLMDIIGILIFCMIAQAIVG